MAHPNIKYGVSRKTHTTKYLTNIPQNCQGHQKSIHLIFIYIDTYTI